MEGVAIPYISSIRDLPNRVAVGEQMDRARSSKLNALGSFGSNPGALDALYHIPSEAISPPPLVVVLHGCTQTAEGYDRGSGWSDLADRHGFAVLFPEQRRANNANLCFNWFDPDDSRRGSGEVLSIRQMIATMVERHGVDPQRIFVTGLSAGGAMTSALLATYPEVFAGGAVIAGLPYGCASTLPQALARMRGRGGPDEAEMAALVRDASDHRGPWPTISIWHGSGDATVNPSNADAIVGQWRMLHDVPRAPSRIEAVDGYPRSVWCDADGREVIEAYSVTGMGHGTPLDTVTPGGCGTAGAFLLEAGISSSQLICRFWGLTPATSNEASRYAQSPASPPRASKVVMPDLHDVSRTAGTRAPAIDVGQVIADALRTAGLMR